MIYYLSTVYQICLASNMKLFYCSMFKFMTSNLNILIVVDNPHHRDALQLILQVIYTYHMFPYLKYLIWYIIVLYLSVRCMYIYYLIKTGIFWQWIIWMLLLNFYSFCSSSRKLNICSLLICIHMWCIHIYFIKKKPFFKGYVRHLSGLAGRWWCDALMFTRSFYPIYHIQYTLKDVFCIKLNKI